MSGPTISRVIYLHVMSPHLVPSFSETNYRGTILNKALRKKMKEKNLKEKKLKEKTLNKNISSF